ncbi:MAG: rhomboid family intramembrane serine protease [Bacillus sp. (in: firmicutes)]
MKVLKVGENVGFKEDYLFWNIIDRLTSKGVYSIITMTDNGREVWLEYNGKHTYDVVRLMRHDYDWANVMKRDLERTLMNGVKIRKQLFKKPISILNVYVSQYKPVDDYSSMINQTVQHEKVSVTSMLLDSEEAAEGLQALEEKTMVPLVISDLSAEVSEAEVLYVKKRAIDNGVQRRKEEQQLFQGKTIITKLFLAIQIAVFIIMEFVGSSESTLTLVEFGAKYNPAIVDGEWWRFLTPVFVHIGLLHLLMNSVALLYIGGEVEKMFGSVRFIFIYLFAGFAGVLGSFIFNPAISAGASGAIFGCFGALLYFGLTNPKLFFRTMGTNIIVLVLINLVFGFTFSGIDNAGHIGGLIGGFLASAVVCLPKRFRPSTAIPAAIVLAAGTLGLLYYGYGKQQDMAQDLSVPVSYYENKDYEKAEDILRMYERTGLANDQTYVILGVVSEHEKKYDQAAVSYQKALEINSDNDQAHIYLAGYYMNQGNVELAEQHLDRALELNPNESVYQQVKQEFDQWKADGH